MVQRIQSVYLLVISFLMTIYLFSPLGSFITIESNSSWGEWGVWGLYTLESDSYMKSTPWFGILSALAAVLPFITIFLFNRRPLQMKLYIVEILILMAVGALFLYQNQITLASVPNDMKSFVTVLSWTCVIPVVSIILTMLAYFATRKDEKLVRSLDRIR